MIRPTEPLEPPGLLLRKRADTQRLALRHYRLTVQLGPDAGATVLVEGPATVGTAPEATLCLSDATVSRLHLELVPRADGVRIKDLGSRNGVFLGGTRVHELWIDSDAVFQVGRTQLSLTAHDEDVGEAPEQAQLGDAIGSSPKVRQLFGVLERAAATRSTVLLMGETGTGKTALARALHARSPRAKGPFVTLDCGAVASSLIESELFGHVKGAFTGAVADRDGAFASADGGTLFLDEIAELPLEVQPKLLRAVESLEVQRVGDGHVRSADVRLVAATHRDLRAEVKAGRFREDLYFRLAVIEAVVPPLRDRLEDLPLLAQHFMRALGRTDVTLSPSLLARLAEYPWPGNVRELRNVIERVLTGDADPLPSAPLPTAGEDLTALPFSDAKERMMESFTKEYFEALIARHGSNVSRLARAAGLARPYVYRLAERYGLKLKD